MPDPFSGGDSLVNVLASMGQTQEMFQRSQQDGATPGITVNTEMGPEGTTHSIELGDADLRTILGTIKNYSQVVDAYQQEIGRLQQQQDRIQKNPILNVLATVGGATAMQDKRLPPIVRALGESSRALNPTYNELEDRKLGVLGQEGQALSRIGALQEAGERTKASIAYRDQILKQNQEKIDEKARADKAGEEAKAETRADLRFRTAATRFDTDLKNSGGKEVTKAQFESGMRAAGINDPDKIAAAYEQYRGAASSYREKRAEDLEAKKFARDNSPAYMKQKEDEENATAVAKHIVDMFHAGKPMDIDALKQVSGAFGSFKAKVFAKITAMDPSISESKLERIVDMENKFTSASSKEGQQLVSFGTFGEHVGELSDVYSTLAKDSGNIPLLNKGWQWLLKNTGDPRVARIVAAIEPVRKEYSSFLLNNRALYKVDRDMADELVNPKMSPRQFMETLNQMGKTVKARYNELGAPYKRLTGVPIENAHPIPDEAREGLKKIGIDMPQPTDDDSGSDPVLSVIKKYAGSR